jgi:hypothetical protein
MGPVEPEAAVSTHASATANVASHRLRHPVPPAWVHRWPHVLSPGIGGRDKRDVRNKKIRMKNELR